MRVLFRVDASHEIGSGHVMRCLTLAHALRTTDATCLFVMANLNGHLEALVRREGFDTALIQSSEGSAGDIIETKDQADKYQADWVVVDHYDWHADGESRLRRHDRSIMVIDDLADRHHECDVILDQNVYDDATQRYVGLVPPTCDRLIGARFALLRPDFEIERHSLRVRPRTPQRALVFFGGSDPTGHTLPAARAVVGAAPHLALVIVIGMQNREARAIEEFAASVSGCELKVQVANMAEVIADADVAIGACGSSALERCALGLPTLTAITADNQRQLYAGLVASGAIKGLGHWREVQEGGMAAAMSEAVGSPDLLSEMERASLALFPDGPTGTARVVRRMIN